MWYAAIYHEDETVYAAGRAEFVKAPSEAEALPLAKRCLMSRTSGLRQQVEEVSARYWTDDAWYKNCLEEGWRIRIGQGWEV